MRGRRPDPAGVKLAKGNPGRRPIGEEASAPLLDDALSTAPDWLDPAARAIWAQIAPDLARMKLLARPDVTSFGRYCVLHALWLAAIDKLKGSDLVVTTTSAHVTMDRVNKHLHAALLIEKRLVDLEDRFGLNPSNRQRIFAQRAAANALPSPLFGGEIPAGQAELADATAPRNPQGPIGLLN